MRASTRALLTGILDYAGTFPPASLSLTESVANYARVWSSADRWLLGRLIVPFASLREFDELASQRLEDGWQVSVVLGAPGPRHNWPRRSRSPSGGTQNIESLHWNFLRLVPLRSAI